jgi:hypothetical protein
MLYEGIIALQGATDCPDPWATGQALKSRWIGIITATIFDAVRNRYILPPDWIAPVYQPLDEEPYELYYQRIQPALAQLADHDFARVMLGVLKVRVHRRGSERMQGCSHHADIPCGLYAQICAAGNKLTAQRPLPAVPETTNLIQFVQENMRATADLLTQAVEATAEKARPKILGFTQGKHMYREVQSPRWRCCSCFLTGTL